MDQLCTELFLETVERAVDAFVQLLDHRSTNC